MTFPVKFITLDLFETCIHIRPSLSFHYMRVARKYGIDLNQQIVESNFRSVYKTMKRDFSHLYYDRKTAQEWWYRVAYRTIVLSGAASNTQATQVDHITKELFEEFKTTRCWDVYPDALDFLDYCREKGLPMVGISNFDGRLPFLLSKLSLSRYFAFILTLADKPNTKCFEKALKHSNCSPTQSCHIGDSVEEDCVPALSMGMKSVLIHRRESKEKVFHRLKQSDIDTNDVILVASLSELKTMI